MRPPSGLARLCGPRAPAPVGLLFMSVKRSLNNRPSHAVSSMVMLRFRRPLLLSLLCVLVMSWGTCPCVFARALKGAPQDETTEKTESAGCPCCQKRAAESDRNKAQDEEPAGHPDECPCCARGGAYRDLPPAGGADVVVPPASDEYEGWLPKMFATAWTLPEGRGWHWEATGPPTALSPHGCPVGIVRLLN